MKDLFVKQEWFGHVRQDVLAGILVALALIPEAIAFSIIAGVDPKVGLYASFCIAIVISFVGGRPGMISAATGAMALVMVDLVADHGLQYLFAATILTGLLQIIFGVCRVSRLMKFIPRSVMVGFVNALAIMIFMAQLPHFVGESLVMYIMTGGALLIIYLMPMVTKVIPSPLIAIIVMTVIAVFGHIDVRTVGDMGDLPSSLPAFLIPDVPFNLETLAIIFPYSLSLAMVGLLESLLTAQIVDDMTETTSRKNKEARGQGIANMITGFFGGMAGCAMIGQSVINTKAGGRGRLSTFVAGAFLMVLIFVMGDLVVQIPMAALVAVMMMVCIGTFDWSSFRQLKKNPKTDSIVMLVTVVIVILTHDLSKGVFAGVLLSAIFFVAKISKLRIVSSESTEGTWIYRVKGQIFFASVTDLVQAFHLGENLQSVVIDLSEARIWDESGVAAIERVKEKYRAAGIDVEVVGMDTNSQKLVKQVVGS
ncbi:SulP family inorganic anion transporter [Bacillus sp. 179-C3.3 HS]|uniref:SulP family inorganic anion transporter n=1 Tax=Bacillus sp. 179-C3.3 HS TaxID=3232162 RepID=UPI0039A25AFB